MQNINKKNFVTEACDYFKRSSISSWSLAERENQLRIETKGLFTWREEDPSTRKILEGGTTFCLVYMQKFRPRCLPSGEGKEEKLSPFAS